MRINSALTAYKELIVVLNYNYSAKEDFIIDVPYSGKYKEVFSSDNEIYGGSGCINEREIDSYKSEYGNDLIKIKLPPLAAAVFEIKEADSKEQAEKKYRKAMEEKEMRIKKEAAEKKGIEKQMNREKKSIKEKIK